MLHNNSNSLNTETSGEWAELCFKGKADPAHGRHFDFGIWKAQV